jgi:hypothetical protein
MAPRLYIICVDRAVNAFETPGNFFAKGSYTYMESNHTALKI